MLSRGLLVRLLFPVVMACGKLLRTDSDGLRRKLIDMNNKSVEKLIRRNELRHALFLLPHCLQPDKCELKITNNIYICSECGRCDIKNLAALGREYNLNINMATGGNMALRLVRDTKPDVIIAVACERDLLSGIRDIYPMPVIGIRNTRPEGPCRNTRVDCGAVEDTVKLIKNL